MKVSIISLWNNIFDILLPNLDGVLTWIVIKFYEPSLTKFTYKNRFIPDPFLIDPLSVRQSVWYERKGAEGSIFKSFMGLVIKTHGGHYRKKDWRFKIQFLEKYFCSSLFNRIPIPSPLQLVDCRVSICQA